jgi:hypothetical protein
MSVLTSCDAAESAGHGHASPAATPSRRAVSMGIMGGRFRFRSDSEALLGVVDAAYGGLPPHRFPGPAPECEVELLLAAHQARTGAGPPPVRTRLDARLPYGIMDEHNYVLVSPEWRRARVVASADMLARPYHLRYELIEYAVFLLAARCQALVPLHGACVGRDGRGVLVLGDSGAGKSTLALHALLRGFEFLSEDAVFVRPHDLLATGVANFLHATADAVEHVGDGAARRWLLASPVIRRRSGVAKFEADLRQAPLPARLAPAPLQLVGTVILSPQRAATPGTMLAAGTRETLAACLAADQAYARTQPGWDRFEQRLMQLPVHCLQRGPHPENSVDVLQRLLG